MSTPPITWKPKAEGIQQILQLFRDQTPAQGETRTREQMEMRLQQMDRMQRHAEFNNYLVYIFSSMKDLPIPLPQADKDSLRSQIGLKLKNNLKENWKTIHPATKEYIKRQILLTIGDSNDFVRNITGTVITTIASHDPAALESWPTLLKQLVTFLEHKDPLFVDGAFNALSKICEDCPKSLDSEKLGRPLNFLIPKLITFFHSPKENIRKYALGSVNNFLLLMPQALATNMEKYMENLFQLTRDPSKEIRKRVCNAFVLLLEVRFDYLRSHIHNVIRFMLAATQDEDDTVGLEACEFWSAYCETKEADLNILKGYLPALVPVLLRGMVYSEIDVLILGGEEEDQHIPDRASDIAPRFHTPATKTGATSTPDPEEDSDDDWEDDPSDWNLRKCSAASLDTLATIFKNDLLTILLPLLQEKLSAKKWEIRESGILALGAVAEGCFQGIAVYLKDLIPYLIHLLKDLKPLVRSITCWTLSRYSKWVMNEQDDEKFFRPLMIELLKRVLDTNKKVQEAACSAFATLEEEAQERLIPYLGGILQNLMHAFKSYQARNMLILYDAIGTLAEAVGPELDKPEYVKMLVRPLMGKWEKLHDEDRNIFPLLECLTSVAQALGKGFAPYAKPVFTRCLQIIEKNLIQQQKAFQAKAKGEDAEFPDKEFIVCALDLLSGLAEGLESSVGELVGAHNRILVLLFECIKDNDADVRQSAFALLGDLAKACIGHLKPHLTKYIPVAAKHLNPKFISVCNNASWAIGEISVKIGGDMKPFINLLMGQLIPIMNQTNLIPSLLENTAITIGRLGLVCPEMVAPWLDKFAHQWCIFLARIRENTEKEHAFRGLCSVIQKNPKGVLQAFPAFCQAIASWNKPKPEIRQTFHQMLHSFKSMLGPTNWPACYGRCAGNIQEQLARDYNLK